MASARNIKRKIREVIGWLSGEEDQGDADVNESKMNAINDDRSTLHAVIEGKRYFAFTVLFADNLITMEHN